MLHDRNKFRQLFDCRTTPGGVSKGQGPIGQIGQNGQNGQIGQIGQNSRPLRVRPSKG